MSTDIVFDLRRPEQYTLVASRDAAAAPESAVVVELLLVCAAVGSYKYENLQ